MSNIKISNTCNAKRYAKIRHVFLFIDLVFTAVIILLFQYSGASHGLEALIRIYCPNFYIKNMIFVVVISVLSALIFFPLNYYSHYHLEHRFNLSNQKFKSWIWDGIKSFFLNLIFSIIAIEVIYSFLKVFPNHWWILTTIFYFFFTIVLSRIMPTLIMPLFYKLKPITNTSLIDKLKILAQKVRARIIGVYQMDMSRKTKKANAMFTGLGKSKRIILGDTLLSNFSEDEIETVLAHELGHYYYKHLWQFIIMGLGTSLLGFYIVHIILTPFISYFGMGEISNIAGLPIFLFVLFLFFLILMPFQNGYSRRLERQADRFALEQTKNPDGFIRAMKKLSEQNLSDPSPSPWVEFFLYNHPSIEKRIKMAEEYINKKEF